MYQKTYFCFFLCCYVVSSLAQSEINIEQTFINAAQMQRSDYEVIDSLTKIIPQISAEAHIEIGKQLLAHPKVNQNDTLLQRVYNFNAFANYRLKNIEAQLSCIQKAYLITLKHDTNYWIEQRGKTLINFSIFYFTNKLFEKAQEKISEAVEVLEKLEAQHPLFNAYFQQMIILNHLKEYQAALLAGDKAFNGLKKINALDEAARVLNLKARILTNIEDLEQAEATINESISLLEPFTEKTYLKNGQILHGLLPVLIAKADYPSALENLKKVTPEIVKLKDSLYLKSAYDYTYQSYRALGNVDSSLHYLELYNQVKKALVEKDNKEAITKLEKTFQEQLQNKELLLMKRDAQVQKLKTNILLFIALGLMGLLGLSFYYFSKLRKQNSLIKISKEKIETSTKLKNQLVALMAHDLRSPLSIIRYSTTLLVHSNEASKNKFDQVLTQVRSATHMIDDLSLKILQIQGLGDDFLNIQECDIGQIIEESLALFSNLEEPKIGLSISKDLPTIQTDVLLLKEVICNLLSNAIKYGPSSEIIQLSAQQIIDKLVLSISDNGPGMPPHVIHMLEGQENPSLYKQKSISQGLGIGLLLSQKATTLLKGTLQVNSSPNGTKINIILPLT